uniref:Transmembrane protein 43 homolog n=2 Tax=Clastoptera arizonana TaxID=38151 RepID=A0A1B6ED33_9HEMI
MMDEEECLSGESKRLDSVGDIVRREILAVFPRFSGVVVQPLFRRRRFPEGADDQSLVDETVIDEDGGIDNDENALNEHKGDNRSHGSFLKFLLGVGFLCGGAVVFFTVEIKVVDIYQLQDFILKNTVKIISEDQINPDNEGKLVIVSGYLSIGEPLTFPDYGVAAPVVFLKKRVQMYQWSSVAHDVSIMYFRTEIQPKWLDKLVDSRHFPKNYQNPRSFPIKSEVIENSEVRIGAYILGKDVCKQFTNFIAFSSDERPENKNIKLNYGIYYHSEDIWEPKIGDLRVQFYYAGHARTQWTVVGKQVKNEILPFKIKTESVIYLQEGIYSIQSIIASKSGNHIKRFLLRCVMWISICGGIYLISFRFINKPPRLVVFQQVFLLSRMEISILISTLFGTILIGWIRLSIAPLFSSIMFLLAFGILALYAYIE